jgi:hypothetical protein
MVQFMGPLSPNGSWKELKRPVVETNKNSHEGMAAHKLVQASHLGLLEI